MGVLFLVCSAMMHTTAHAKYPFYFNLFQTAVAAMNIKTTLPAQHRLFPRTDIQDVECLEEQI